MASTAENFILASLKSSQVDLKYICSQTFNLGNVWLSVKINNDSIS